MTKQQARRVYYAALGIHDGTDGLTRMAAASRFEDYWRHTHRRRPRTPSNVTSRTLTIHKGTPS